MDDGVGIGGGIDALFLIEMVGLPVGELGGLGDALVEEVGPELLETLVFDAHAGCQRLQINVTSGMEAGMTVTEHPEVVVEGETDLEDCGIFKQFDETGGKSHHVETEEETDPVACYLQEGDLVLHAAFEAGTCLGVNAKVLEGAEIFDCTDSLTLTLDDDDATAECIARKGGDECLVGLLE